ncbi:MAG: hypothetical protein HXY34_08340 [Candidatus Thorarchaeota archaeon]|nr:hypothetical protein [Candidatus Thorarchaeota archaeon]
MTSDDTCEFESNLPHGLFRFRIIRLANGYLVLVTDSESFRFGVSAIAAPPVEGSRDHTSMSLLGTGLDTTLVRTIAERVSVLTNSTCMLMVAVSGLDRNVMMEIAGALRSHFSKESAQSRP